MLIRQTYTATGQVSFCGIFNKNWYSIYDLYFAGKAPRSHVPLLQPLPSCPRISPFTVPGAHVHWVGSSGSTATPMWQGWLFLSQPITTLEDAPITEESLYAYLRSYQS